MLKKIPVEELVLSSESFERDDRRRDFVSIIGKADLVDQVAASLAQEMGYHY